MRTRLLASGFVAALIVGVLVARLSRTVDAQSAGRLSLIPAGNGMAFISDSRSGGCWLANLAGSGQARFENVTVFAPAPAAACK